MFYDLADYRPASVSLSLQRNWKHLLWLANWFLLPESKNCIRIMLCALKHFMSFGLRKEFVSVYRYDLFGR
jgi:hypothetical protein